MQLLLRLMTSYVFVFCIEGENFRTETLNQECSFLVAPNNTSCPIVAQIPCLNFSMYIQNASLYFRSQSTFCFLSGEHLVGDTANLMISNVSSLTLVGLGSLILYSVADKVNEYGLISKYDDDKSVTFLQSKSVIKCDKEYTFIFNNIFNLSLINLTLVNCGGPVNMLHMQDSYIGACNVSVLLQNISNLILQTVSIQNSTGYGLLGMNILGHSSILHSSFVANNQIVRNFLQLYNESISFCFDNSYYSSPLIYINSAIGHKYAGGNAVFIYTELPNLSTASSLAITSCLFTLSIDGSFQGPKVSKYFSNGTGLGIKMYQYSYTVDAIISDSVMYRNQASVGANLNLLVNPMNCNIILSNVSSSRGRSITGGGLYYSAANSYSNINANQSSFLTVSSTFSADYNYPNCVYFDLSNQSSLVTIIQMQQCIFLANVVIMSSLLDSATVHHVIMFANSTFAITQCDGGIGAYYSTVNLAHCTFNRTNIFALESDVSVSDSTFTNNYGSSMELYNCHLNLTGKILFANNTSYGDGGALYLSLTSVLLTAPVNVSFIANNATYRGGAIFAINNPSNIAQIPCMFQFNDPNGTLDHPGIHLYFDDNYATLAGSVLYGGNIDSCPFNCTLLPKYEKCSLLAIGNSVTTFGRNQTSSSLVSSDAKRICNCADEAINCSIQEKTRAYPGQVLQFSIVAVGQNNGISPDTVISYRCDVYDADFSLNSIENCTDPLYFSEQHTTQYCIKYNYTVEGRNKEPIKSVIFLYPRTAYVSIYFIEPYYIFLDIQPCPYGFQYDQSSNACGCDYLLLAYNIQCSIDTQMVRRTGTFWIGNNTNNILAVHSHCPNEYCITGDAMISIVDQQEQCSYNRTGILCGKCAPNTSAMFGSVRCKPCSYQYLWLLVPIAFMGILLLASLFVLNCTISVGTINGLILYANIIRPSILNLLTLTHLGGFGKALLVAIDWLNLDLGIETCFYSDMDTYAKTWLQLLFPVYIFILVGAIIIGSRWSSRMAWVCRYNAVSVLGTLILLSYTKFLATIITIFSSTQLDVGNSTAANPRIWLVDGNVVYAEGKHVPLFVAGLFVTVAFITPYTAILLLSPWLQAKSEWKIFQWVNKLKPFLDAYQAPFKDQYRYWPGVLLMVRVLLYLVYTLNDGNDININLLATILVLSFYCCVANTLSVYKRWPLNILDSFFLLNIIFFASLTLYTRDSNASINSILTIISTGSSLSVLVGVVCFHVYRKVKGIDQIHCAVGKFRGLDTVVQFSGASASLVASPTCSVQNNTDPSEVMLFKYGTYTEREALMEES